MNDCIAAAIKDAQFTLDNGDPDLLKGGRYAGKRNPTESELKGWRNVLAVAEDRGSMNRASLDHMTGILDRWEKATQVERAIAADVIWTLTCSLRIGTSDAPSASATSRNRTRKR